jgi:catechol 2,3-dioxygenase-like lactoylglutathione lyase family enzyme
MSLVLNGKSQIILYIKNMNSEVRFYRDILGLPIRFPQGLADYSDEMWVEFDLGEHSLALHGGADSQPDDQHEVVFWVENVARTREMIITAGIQMNEIRDLEDGFPIAEGRDPDGHRFAIRS